MASAVSIKHKILTLGLLLAHSCLGAVIPGTPSASDAVNSTVNHDQSPWNQTSFATSKLTKRAPVLDEKLIRNWGRDWKSKFGVESDFLILFDANQDADFYNNLINTFAAAFGPASVDGFGTVWYCPRWGARTVPFCVLFSIHHVTFVENVNRWTAWHSIIKAVYDYRGLVLKFNLFNKYRPEIMTREKRGKSVLIDPSINTPWDLRIYSTPPPLAADRIKAQLKLEANGVSEEMWVEETEGEGVNIYALCSGLSKDAASHPVGSINTYSLGKEFKEALAGGRVAGWILNPINDMQQDDVDPQFLFRGTTGLSRFFGRRGGLAKKANVWVVPWNEDPYFFSDLLLLDQFFKIKDHISREQAKNPDYKAIVYVAAETKLYTEQMVNDPQLTPAEAILLARIGSYGIVALQAFSKLKNTVLVTDAGDNRDPEPTSTWPAQLGVHYGDNMVVVGGVGPEGALMYQRMQDFVKVNGFASGVEVPFFRQSGHSKGSRVIQGGYEFTNAPEFASAAVAAIMAQYWSANKKWTVKELISKLYGNAYPRYPNGAKVAWTGVRPRPIEICKARALWNKNKEGKDAAGADPDCMDQTEG
ncbi:hypothetical protein TWF730_003688 [Orbilia blumenaviensis]|uniref:Peptidase S8/S53 domain-containing protein n=1 Tax=Orbilia blumenaviensis TaxID=1796055 RepID=A0AAV9U300_9PEZI